MLEKRYLTNYILKDLTKKMVFVGGPRQVGKTTISRELIGSLFKNPLYLNWDNRHDRKRIMTGNWHRENDLLILDEVHKYSKWKSLIKGYYDVEKEQHDFLITGSARLNIYRKGNDSLQGRYHYYRCHPFTIAEINDFHSLCQPFSNLLESGQETKAQGLSDLLAFGGFPEPFLAQEHQVLRRWHNEKIERLFREDINEVENIRDLQSMKLLSDIIPDKIGSLLSINNISNDLQKSYTAIASWIEILDLYYYHFRVYPYQGKNIRSLKKEPKIYLWDWSEVDNDSARFENLIAAHLLKFVHLLYDYEGYKSTLYFIRDRDQREIDFLVTIGDKPWFAVEVKLHDTSLSKNIKYFQERLNIPFVYQVVKNSNINIPHKNAFVISADDFLKCLV